MTDPESGPEAETADPAAQAKSATEQAAQRRRPVDQLFDAALDLTATERASIPIAKRTWAWASNQNNGQVYESARRIYGLSTQDHVRTKKRGHTS